MQRPFNYSVHIQNFKRLLTFAACAKSVVSEQATSKLPVSTLLDLICQYSAIQICYTNCFNVYMFFFRILHKRSS